MSDIPRAKEILDEGIAAQPGNEAFLRYCMREARKYLDREKPEFKAPPTIRKLTMEEEQEARALRSQGWPINGIARRLHTNIGRVSEAINGK